MKELIDFSSLDEAFGLPTTEPVLVDWDECCFHTEEAEPWNKGLTGLDYGSYGEDNPTKRKEVRQKLSEAAVKKWKDPEYRKSQCAALSKARRANPVGNKSRTGYKNKPHHTAALIKSNISRSKLYNITKGETSHKSTMREFCEMYGYSVASCRNCLRKSETYKGWVFTLVE